MHDLAEDCGNSKFLTLTRIISVLYQATHMIFVGNLYFHSYISRSEVHLGTCEIRDIDMSTLSSHQPRNPDKMASGTNLGQQ